MHDCVRVVLPTKLVARISSTTKLDILQTAARKRDKKKKKDEEEVETVSRSSIISCINGCRSRVVTATTK